MAAIIKNIATFLPSKVLTNKELCKISDKWTEEKIYNKTGILERRISSKNETSLDLGIKAAKKLFSKFPEIKNKIDYLIFCTQTPDYFLPSGSCIIQDKLNIRKDIGTIDINQGCTGFVYGLSLSKGLIEGKIANNVLLITSDTYSKIINQNDLSVRTIFGDGACATLVSEESSNTSGIDEFIFGSDGSKFDKLIVQDGGFRNKEHFSKQGQILDKFGNQRNLDNLYMDGAGILVFTLDVVPRLVNNLLEKSKLGLEDIDHFIFHQANDFLKNVFSIFLIWYN